MTLPPPGRGEWPPETVRLAERQLDELEAVVRHPPLGTTDDVDGVLARFLVIRACGYLEQTLDLVLRAYIEAHANARVAAYTAAVRARSRGSNPNPNNVSEILRSLDPTWGTEFTLMLNEDSQRMRTELTFMVESRNKIAHGVSETIGRRRALDLVGVSKSIADWIILQLDPRRGG